MKRKLYCLFLMMCLLLTLFSGCENDTSKDNSNSTKDLIQETLSDENINDTEAQILEDELAAIRDYDFPDDYIRYHTLVECHELLSESDPQNVDSDGTPTAIIHCQAGTQNGYYVENIVSYEKTGHEIKSCSHGMVGGVDIRYEYTDHYEAYCTLCPFTARFTELRHGFWTCKLP